MFGNKTENNLPTVRQVKAIIEYMEKDPHRRYDFSMMMDLSRPDPHTVALRLENESLGVWYEATFNEAHEVVGFEQVSTTMY